MKPCKNFDVCGRYIGNTGTICEHCEADARELDGETNNWRATGWDRSDNRKDAQQGHKGEGKGK
jgi:predicted nucleic acid-binding Zn ribbon protein